MSTSTHYFEKKPPDPIQCVVKAKKASNEQWLGWNLMVFVETINGEQAQVPWEIAVIVEEIKLLVETVSCCSFCHAPGATDAAACWVASK